MRQAILAVLMLAVAVPAFAAAEPIRLSDGEVVEVTHPGTDGVGHPRAILARNEPPGYPVSALGLGEDSSVVLAVLVREDGSVAQAEVVGADHPGAGFEDAAVRAVRGWSFRPARDGRRKVNSYAFVSVSFKAPEDPHALFATAPRPGAPLPFVGRVPNATGLASSGSLRTTWNRPAGVYGPLVQRVQIPQVGYGQLYYRPNLTAARPTATLPSPRVPLPIAVTAPGAGGR